MKNENPGKNYVLCLGESPPGALMSLS